MTQQEFASEVEIKRARLASYEECRAPVRFDIALAICRQFLISEKWLATGKGDIRTFLDLESERIRVPKDMFFGAAYDHYYASSYELIFEANKGCLRFNPDRAYGLTFWKNLFNLLLERWHRDLSPEEYLKLLFALQRAGILLVDMRYREGKMPEFIGVCEDAFGVSIHDLSKLNEAIGREKEENSKRFELTEAAICESVSSVKSPLDALRSRVKKITQTEGKLLELSEYLKAPYSSVSRWLSGKREPGGEIALKLLKWVEQQERSK